jgi:hypothetical protein
MSNSSLTNRDHLALWVNLKTNSKEDIMRSKLIISAGVIVSMLFLYSGIGFCQEKVSGSEWTQIIEQMGNKGYGDWYPSRQVYRKAAGSSHGFEGGQG